VCIPPIAVDYRAASAADIEIRIRGNFIDDANQEEFMKAIKLVGLLIIAALALAACGTSVPSAAPTSAPAPAAAAPTQAPAAPTSAPAAGGAVKKEPKDIKILVDMKGPGGGNPFWAAVQKGAEGAGQALGVQLTVLAPPQESDVPAQIAQIEDAITKGVDGIAIAPTDPAALAPVLQKAIDAGVKVVFIDTKGQNAGVTFIGTNNEAGAKLAADYMCKNLKPADKVAILQGIITQSTGKARADGAHNGLSACGLNIVAETPAEWDTAKGQAAMEDILTKNPDLKAVFGSNDNMALGAVEAIKNAKLSGKIMVVGFDANPNAAAAILAGDMNASVAQAPSNMGKLGVESLLKLIQGETLDPVIDTGTELVTKDNADKYK
jgi:ABC-type sugar transport system substrate-binding protein